MIASTINYRTEGNKVNKQEVWVLHQILNPNCYTNVPFVLAKFLSESCEPKSTNYIFDSQYVTLLARYFNILTNEVIQSMNRLDDMQLIDRNQMVGMNVIKPGPVRGSWIWTNKEDEDEDEDEDDNNEEEGKNTGGTAPPPVTRAGPSGTQDGPSMQHNDYENLCNRMDGLASGLGHLTDSVNSLVSAYHDLTESNRRLEYANWGTQHEISYQRNVMNDWFAHQQPPYQPPPSLPMPCWEPNQPPPYEDPSFQSSWFGFLFPGQHDPNQGPPPA